MDPPRKRATAPAGGLPVMLRARGGSCPATAAGTGAEAAGEAAGGGGRRGRLSGSGNDEEDAGAIFTGAVLNEATRCWTANEFASPAGPLLRMRSGATELIAAVAVDGARWREVDRDEGPAAGWKGRSASSTHESRNATSSADRDKALWFGQARENWSTADECASCSKSSESRLPSFSMQGPINAPTASF